MTFRGSCLRFCLTYRKFDRTSQIIWEKLGPFDAGLAAVLEVLQQTGELDNTMIVISGDHGAPGFPRGKCNLYDFGTQVPLIVSMPGQSAPRVVGDFVNLMDLAPTFLEVGGLEPPEVMTGKSLVPVLNSKKGVG